jgi:HSP20 family protein
MLSRSTTVREPDRLTARVFDSASRSGGCRLETYRDGDTFYIDIDLPGVDPADIEVSVDGAVLTIRAERKRVEREGRRLVVAERLTGTFTRQVVLSDTLDTDRLDARYDDGLLTLSIPVTETAEPRKLEVTTGTEPELAPAA